MWRLGQTRRMTLKKIAGIAAIVVLALLVLRGCGDGQGMGRNHDDHGDRGSMSDQGVTVQAIFDERRRNAKTLGEIEQQFVDPDRISAGAQNGFALAGVS